MSARVVHVRDQVPGAVYIGRRMNRYGLAASPFANPFPVGMGRRASVESYREWLSDRPGLIRQLADLRDKPLACWCRYDGEEPTEDTLCHGDVLVRFLEYWTDEELETVAWGRAAS